MRSLFILSLPRSYSSETFRHARDALRLQPPIWTTDGEILNNDRSVLYLGDRREAGLKFTTREASPEQFAQVTAFLDEIICPEGFVYKDVVQPFVTTAWLAGRADLAVLKILPDLTHVVASIIAMGWSYPALASDGEGGQLRRIAQGVLRAERAIMAVPGEVVRFGELIDDEAPLRAALQRLYPTIEVPPLGYVTRDFRTYRDIVLQRRLDPTYQAIGRLVSTLRQAEVDGPGDAEKQQAGS